LRIALPINFEGSLDDIPPPGSTAAVVSYALDDGTVVRFGIEPGAGFRPTGPDEIVGRIREAVARR
jgi:hypothetical protein